MVRVTGANNSNECRSCVHLRVVLLRLKVVVLIANYSDSQIRIQIQIYYSTVTRRLEITEKLRQSFGVSGLMNVADNAGWHIVSTTCCLSLSKLLRSIRPVIKFRKVPERSRKRSLSDVVVGSRWSRA